MTLKGTDAAGFSLKKQEVYPEPKQQNNKDASVWNGKGCRSGRCRSVFCCKCSDVNAPNDYMRSNAGHNHLKINKGGGTLYKENVPPPDSIQF
jgi:hypothetical protein